MHFLFEMDKRQINARTEEEV